jgi:hypothetical protein
MCLIAYADKDRNQIPEIHLARAHARNDDSWGIMFPEDGHVRLIRDVSDHAAFLAVWNRMPRDTPIAVHFRYGTSGSMSAEMAHPFPVLEDEGGVTLAVMHNGVMNCIGEEGLLSDTAVFIRDVLKPQLEAVPGLIEVEGWREAMGAVLGEDNKLLFMRGDGAVFLINGWQGQFEADGVWYSNTYSIEPPRPKPIAADLFAGSGHAGWPDRYRDDLFRQMPRGDLALPRPYADPLDAIDEMVEPYSSLIEMSDAEIYHFVCESSPEDVTDAILELMSGR